MNHLTAKELVDSLGLTQPESLYLRMVAWAESNYGSGWTSDGVGSHNWGAVQGVGPAGFFMHVDHDAAGREYTAKFKRYNSDLEAAQDLAAILLKANVRSALPNLEQAVRAQINVNFYTGNPPATPAPKYLARLTEVMATIVRVTGESPLDDLKEVEPAPSYSSASLLTSRTVFEGLNVLARNSRGPDVAFIQCVLKMNGSPNLVIDGWFGPLTDAAVREFQHETPLLGVDGIVGSHTWRALTRISQYDS